MKRSRNIFVFALSFGLSILLLPALIPTIAAAQSNDPSVALQRGYRTGYSDGYMAGYRDRIDNSSRDISRHADYAKADRAYNKDYGTADDYRDGYQQGFEKGYDTGFDKRSFESTMPTGLKRRGTITTLPAQTTVVPEKDLAKNDDPVATPADNNTYTATTATAATNLPNDTYTATAITTPATSIGANDPVIIIPRETELLLELQDDLSTETSREGEKFTAKVVSPSEIAGAIIEGRVSRIRQPGRIKRRSELVLSFDRIILNDDRWANFNATLMEVMPVKGDNIKLVDNEGTAVGKSSLKGDMTKVGGATGAGLLVGAVVGGPVGAAVGAGVGAAFGVGAVVIERGKHIRLNQNQQLRIKTAYETQIR